MAAFRRHWKVGAALVCATAVFLDSYLTSSQRIEFETPPAFAIGAALLFGTAVFALVYGALSAIAYTLRIVQRERRRSVSGGGMRCAYRNLVLFDAASPDPPDGEFRYCRFALKSITWDVGAPSSTQFSAESEVREAFWGRRRAWILSADD
jgi:hypothetical protein